MTIEVVKYQESLNNDELAFLRRREERERRQTYKIIRVFMILCFLCPFIVAWFRALGGQENPFSLFHYFIGVVFLLCFSAAGIYWGYYHNLRRVQLDLKYATKTIERVFITRKQYMPVNNAYFFYLSSAVRLSIEVSEPDYRRLEVGDELNIEYATYSRMYFGYF